MTPRSFLILALRVIAILLIRNLILSITDVLAAVWSTFELVPSRGLLLLFFSLIKTILILALGYWLIFKTEKIIDSFGLDKGFGESHLQLNLSMRAVLRISLIITGAIILVYEIPQLAGLAYDNWVFRSYAGRVVDVEPFNWSPVITSGIRIILALLIIGERKRIIDFLVKENENDPFQPKNSSDLQSR